MVTDRAGGGMVKSLRSRGPPTFIECKRSIRPSITGSQATQTHRIAHRLVNDSTGVLAWGDLGCVWGGTMGSHL